MTLTRKKIKKGGKYVLINEDARSKSKLKTKKRYT